MITKTSEEINELKEENQILKKNSKNLDLLTTLLDEIVSDSSDNSTGNSENSISSNSAN